MYALVRIFENVPSLLFFALWRSTEDIQLAGWVGAVSAIVVLLITWHRRLVPHPVLLAINFHFSIATPAIEAAYRFVFKGLASFFLANASAGVLFAVGSVYKSCASMLCFL